MFVPADLDIIVPLEVVDESTDAALRVSTRGDCERRESVLRKFVGNGENFRRTPDYDLYEELKSIFTALRTAKLQATRR